MKALDVTGGLSGLSPLVKNGITAPNNTVVKIMTPSEVVTMTPL